MSKALHIVALILVANTLGCRIRLRDLTPPTPAPIGWIKPTPAPPQLQKVAREPLSDDELLVTREHQLTRDIWAAHGPPIDNAVLSPASLMDGMMLVTEGSRGETASQLATGLYLSPRRLPGDSQTLRTAVERTKPRRTEGGVIQDQRLYVGGQVTITPAFVEMARLQFSTFVLPTVQSGKDVWLAQHGQATPSPVSLSPTASASQVPEEGKLLLINFIQMKARWLHPFPLEATHHAVFYSSLPPEEGTGSQSKRIPTMQQRGKFKYHDGPGYRLLELPYEGKNLAFDCILPKRRDGLAEVEKTLTRQALDDSLRAMRSKTVNLQIPRFEIQQKWDLTPWMRQIAPLALDPKLADFSPISPDRLYLREISQEVSLSVGEIGTEALATTKISAIPAAPATPKAKTKVNFFVDHPFLFVIRDVRSGFILFVGRVVYPGNPES